MKKKYLFIFTIMIILALMLLTGVFLLNDLHNYQEGNQTYEEIKAVAVKTQTVKEDESGIDFEELRKINPDVVGWLSMKDTVIDYPVVKGKDNDYYLKHLFTGEYNTLGTLFVDFRNYDLFEDKNTIIYGHSMLNGSMFFILEEYKKQSFYDEHPEFTFVTPDKSYLLKPIAGKIMDAKEPFVVFDFADDQVFLDYVNGFIKTSTFRSKETINGDDKIVMMIKCSHDFEDARYVLVCKVSES